MNDERKHKTTATAGSSGNDDISPAIVYCRVSTHNPDQKPSYALQINYYNDLLRKHADDGHSDIAGGAYE